MNKDTFLKALRKQLKQLKKSEIQKNISYYDELISDMLENGLSEADALARIGAPEQIAREILQNTAPESFRQKDIPGRILMGASIITLLLSLLEAFRIYTIAHTTISIIGGADGPTSIFIAGKLNWPRMYGIAAVVVTVTVVYFLVKYWKHKKN